MKRVLVAVMDWGLGHASRSIPVISELIELNCEVHIAGYGASLELLKREFPSLTFHQLPGYDPQYPDKGSMVWKMARQLPHFISVIKREHQVTDVIVKQYQINFIISDNRYGCYSTNAKSVLITHQSNVLMPKRFGWLSGCVRWAVRNRLKKFDECWIPDFNGALLSGKLNSFGKIDHPSFHFIGILSRFKLNKSIPKKHELLAIFSGPEPQRSIFERIVWQQLKASGKSFFIVRGLPFSNEGINENNVMQFATSNQLQELIESSEIVIARSGYSTIMDLLSLNKKAILVPTPGQTEQEYLAGLLHNNKMFVEMTQEQFNLMEAVNELSAGNYSPNAVEHINIEMKKVIRNFVTPL